MWNFAIDSVALLAVGGLWGGMVFFAAVFAPLVLAAHVLAVHSGATEVAAATYFFARIAHAMAYTFAIPWLRTISFTVGFACQATFAVVLLTS